LRYKLTVESAIINNMIGKLTGKITEKELGYVILETGGVGYLVRVTNDTEKDLRLGESKTLWTHLAIKEDSHELYGFLEKDELVFFKLLIGISGIGPKTALGVLSIAPPKTLQKAIVSGNTSYLTKVSGIGKKVAEKIILELKDKLHTVIKDNDTELSDEQDVILALRSLGYEAKDAREALKKVSDTSLKTTQKIKEALKFLGKNNE